MVNLFFKCSILNKTNYKGHIMIILGLGYITIKSEKLDDWTELVVRILECN